MQILVLEKSPMIRRLIREELSWGTYSMLEAENPAEARQALLTQPDIAMLALGTALDGMDGFDFLAELKEPEFQERLAAVGNVELHTVFVTSNDNDADRLRGYRIGAADFIQKPWRRGEFLAHVDSVLGRDSEMQGLSVLVVDDSRTTRHFVQSCLGRMGVQVHEADDGDTALAFLRENRVDMVLTDLNMVRMNGDELCLKIRNELGWTDTPVIFLSATENRSEILPLFKIGATDYLLKPFLREELMARLKVHLQRELLTRTLRELAGMDATEVSPAGVSAIGCPDALVEMEDCRVLLVDDVAADLTIGCRLLQRMGCDVTAVASGEEALAAFSAHNERFDLVLLDLIMPGLDGLETARELRKVEAASGAEGQALVPIIALSATHAEDMEAECRAAGMNDFLAKPFRYEMVREALEKWSKTPV